MFSSRIKRRQAVHSRPPLESDVVGKILRYLNSLDYCYAFKVHGDMFSAGHPDIIGCYKGKFIFFEAKRDRDHTTSDRQDADIEKWAAAGGVGGVVWSLDQVKWYLESIT